MTTVLLLSAGALFLICGALFFPSRLGLFINGGTTSIALLVGITIATAAGVNKRFGKFTKTPELARRYASKAHRRGALFFYWAFGAGWLLVAVLTLVHKHS